MGKKEVKEAIEYCRSILPVGWQIMALDEKPDPFKRVRVRVNSWDIDCGGRAQRPGLLEESRRIVVVAGIDIWSGYKTAMETSAILLHELAHVAVNRIYIARGLELPVESHGECFLRAFSCLINRATRVHGDRAAIHLAQVNYQKYAKG